MRITPQGQGEPLTDPQAEVPDAILRPGLALWLWERNIETREAGGLFGCSHTHVVNICRPFDDPLRKRPKEDLLAAIVRVTRGEIAGPDFDPPDLRGRWVKPIIGWDLGVGQDLGAGDPEVLRLARTS